MEDPIPSTSSYRRRGQFGRQGCDGGGHRPAAQGARLPGGSIQKLDPYINVDPGTMSPYQHGEVYVLDDGAETDLDLGHYERFIDIEPEPGVQRHHRPGLRRGHRQGASRGFPGRDDPGHPAHHQRDQAPDRAGAQRDLDAEIVLVEVGGTVGRHREPAVPRGAAPDAHGARAREHLLRPRHLAAAHRRHRRAEDQAHPALRRRAALDRHLSRT